MPEVLKIALPTPLRQLFDYLADDECSAAGTGARVLVPFGTQRLVGIVMGREASSELPANKLRAPLALLDQQPLIPPEILELCQWVSDYYHHPIGEVMHAALPVQLRQAAAAPEIPEAKLWQHSQEGKGLPQDALRGTNQRLIHRALLQHQQLSESQLKEMGATKATLSGMQKKGLIEQVSAPRTETDSAVTPLLLEAPLQLNAQQQAAAQTVKSHQYASYLLDGATGSGKTEVYLQAIGRTLQLGLQALVLVPEIGLTPQTLQRFEKRFKVPIVQLHSNISQKQRSVNWLMASRGQARIVIGTRLAVFTPMPQLGIIVLDEEHDLSFKQHDGLLYSARDVAVLRAHRLNIPLILGSATPALETLFKSQSQRYVHLHLSQRAGNAKPPQFECIDMRQEPAENVLAAATLAAIAQRLERGEQVIIFINRRGFAPALICSHCGWSAQCRACDRRLTLHYCNPHLRCHHCDFRQTIPKQCPSCNSAQLNTRGKGTERIELLLQSAFPQVEVIRVDQDSMRAKQAMAKLGEKMQRPQPCILVGTQMLAKGHHFPRVTLAVLLDVDQGLYSGDFRSAERMGQQIIQVAGRSGRGDLPGLVLLQTYQPDHPLLQYLITESYHRFAQALLKERELTNLPPYSHMALFRAESKRGATAMEFLQHIKSLCLSHSPASPSCRYLGPLPALIEKRNDRYRFQLQLIFDQRPALHAVVSEVIRSVAKTALAARTRWSVDIDPLDLS